VTRVYLERAINTVYVKSVIACDEVYWCLLRYYGILCNEIYLPMSYVIHGSEKMEIKIKYYLLLI
jgi:hypothetical protein